MRGLADPAAGAAGRESRVSTPVVSAGGRGGAIAVPRKRYAPRVIKWVRLVAFASALIPVTALVVGFFTDDLTANPIEYITRQTGYWALTMLVITLTVTPVRRLTGWNEVIKLRRMFGLFAFFYGTLHLLTWIVLDKFFDFPWMLEDIAMRRFITIGMLTWLLLLPLAITSTKKMVKRLGRRWQTLHRLSYVAAVTGVIHYWWLVKADLFYPQMLSAALAVLFAIRVWWTWRTRMLSRS
jgi:sulfoxide reductase heme-binding subunit YedZ